MDFLHRIASGFIGVLLPWIWLAAALPPADADSGAYWLTNGRKHSPGAVWPHVPPVVQPFSSSPGFADRSLPMSQRPFAQPFIDRGPSVAERPLAPIGGGGPTVPDSTPFVWCHGHWLRAIPPSYGCAAH
jgi:hypothetical protein